MYIKQFKIKGNSVGEIIDLIDEDLKIISFNPVDQVHIFITEKYYLRNNAQLMACIIFKIEDDYSLTIDIVAGGGATGLFGVDLGAEGNSVDEIIKMLEEICQDKGWDLLEKANL